jgi:S-adenosylmethionine hydrolase
MGKAKLSRGTMSIWISMSSKIATLTTDFGLKDPYVAEMKAAILSICPNTDIVDITHEIEKFNVRMGAYVLASAAPYFQKGSVHIAVVDPGVGTKRRPILIQTKKGFFVGPDNGILVLAAEKQGILHIHELANPQFMLPEVSNTFHGRDIFSPAAAYLLNNVKPAEFGPEIQEVIKPKFAKVAQKNDLIVGSVLHVDGFGNIITNIPGEEVAESPVKGEISVELSGYKLRLKLRKTYGEAKAQEPLAIIGSHNFLEIALNRGNAAKKFKTKPGDSITVTCIKAYSTTLQKQ